MNGGFQRSTGGEFGMDLKELTTTTIGTVGPQQFEPRGHIAQDNKGCYPRLFSFIVMWKTVWR